jgi:hypothetical protein
MINFPRRVIVGELLVCETNTEKSELIAERTVLFIFQVSGVIPPFDAKLVVRKVIERKLICIPRKGLLIRGPCNNRWQAEIK